MKLTNERLAEIENYLAGKPYRPLVYSWETEFMKFVPELLAEVRRLQSELEEYEHWNDGPICTACDMPRECPDCGPLFEIITKSLDSAEARVAELEAQLDSRFDDGFEHGVNWRSAGNYKNPREAAANHRKRVGGAE